MRARDFTVLFSVPGSLSVRSMKEISGSVSSCPVCAAETSAMPASSLSNAGGSYRGLLRRTGLILLTLKEAQDRWEKDPDGRKLKTPKKSWRRSGGNSK